MVHQVQPWLVFAADTVGRGDEHFFSRRPGRAVFDGGRIAFGPEQRRGFRLTRFFSGQREGRFGELNIANGRQRQQAPIACQQNDGHSCQDPRLEKTKQQPGEKVSQRNPVQHTHQAHVWPAVGEPRGI